MATSNVIGRCAMAIVGTLRGRIDGTPSTRARAQLQRKSDGAKSK